MSLLPKRIEAAVFVLIGQGVQSIASFVTGLILARVSGQEELGLFALGFSFCFMVICLGDTLVSTPYTYFNSRSEKYDPDLFAAALGGALLLGVLVGVVVFFIIFFTAVGLKSVLVSLPLAVVTLALREFYRRHLYAVGEMRVVLIGDVMAGVTQVSMMLLFSNYEAMSADAAFISISVASILAGALFALRGTISLHALNVKSILLWLRRFFVYGRWLVLGTACHVASIQLYPWLALVSGGASNAGMYAACVAVTNLMNPLFIGLTNYFRPKLMLGVREKNRKNYLFYVSRIVSVFVVPSLLFWFVIFIYGDGVLYVIYGEGFSEGVGALLYMSVGVVAVALSSPLQLTLLAARAPVTNLIYHGFSLGLLLLLSVFFLPVLTLPMLGVFYGGVNVASLAVLLFLFWKQVVRN